MSQAPIWPVATDAFIADTTHLSAEETGAYAMLLMCLWRSNDAGLSNEPGKLCRMARVTPNRWPKVWDSIKDFFYEEGGTIHQKRIRKDWSRVQEKIIVNRTNASKGGKAKSLKTKETDLANATNSPEPKQPIGVPNHEPLTKDKKKKILKEKFLPEDFPDAEAKDKARAYWKQKGVSLDADGEALAFRGHYDGAKVKSPEGRWQTWYVRAAQFAIERGGTKGAVESTVTQSNFNDPEWWRERTKTEFGKRDFKSNWPVPGKNFPHGCPIAEEIWPELTGERAA